MYKNERRYGKKSFLSIIIAIIFLFFGCGQADGPIEMQPPERSQHLQASSSQSGKNAVSFGTLPEKRAVPSEWEDDGIFSVWYHEAYKMLKTMTAEEKAGQMLFARCPERDGAEEAARYQLGGYVLFKRDFQDRSEEQVRKFLEQYRISTHIPMAFSVDEEGGSVVRISSNAKLREKPYLSPQELYRRGGWDLIRQDAQEKGSLLEELGVDVLLAPVADIAESSDDYIYSRTLGSGAEDTATYVETVVEEIQQSRVSATLKHFPGYGGNADTHKTDSVDVRDLAEFRERDFIPFRAGIKAGADLVLVSHNIVGAIDPCLPASLSPETNSILRKELGFTGIIITDDLAMAAARTDGSGEISPVVQAALAGNNMIIVTNYAQAHEDLLAALAAGILTEKQIDSAVFRILAWKYKLGLLSPEVRPVDGPDRKGDGQDGLVHGSEKQDALAGAGEERT